MDSIEFADPVTGSCQCCGSPTIQLARFVHRNGEPFAVYRALLPHGPHERRADLVISLGDWAETASPSNRVTFACHLTAAQDNFNVGWSNLTKPPGLQGNLDEFCRETRPSSIPGSRRSSI
jgi:hypothetical protein